MGQVSIGSVPPAPRAPSPRARELIFRFHGGQLATLFIGAVFLLLGLGMIVPFNWGLGQDIAMLAGARTLHGHVISTEVDRSVKINRHYATRIRFEYSIDGQRYQGASSTIDTRLIDQAKQPDASMPVEVASMNPQWARLQGTTHSAFGWSGLFLLIFPVIGAAVMTLTLRAHLRERRAFTEGMPVVAKVVNFGPDYSTRINGRNPFRVRWEFRVPQDERVFTGTLSSMTMLSLEDLGKSQEIVVLYDPADPSINTAWVS